MSTPGFLGIDAGTQGLSVVWADEAMRVSAVGNGSYDMVDGLDNGCFEQRPTDWLAALHEAVAELRSKVGGPLNVLAIGISGQMHGEVVCSESGEPLCPARLWCDARNEEEGRELTSLFGVKMPKRITTARWLRTIRERPDIARSAKRVTTPAGWLAFSLTGEWNLGIGDAAGMFPIDQRTLDYDKPLLTRFDELVADGKMPKLRELLPNVRKAGEAAGSLTAVAADLLDLQAGIPVAAAEGDQPAALAGSLIGDAGMVSLSFGTSVCANSVGDRSFKGVHDAIDHFCAPDGKPINMVFLRNGTTFHEHRGRNGGRLDERPRRNIRCGDAIDPCCSAELRWSPRVAFHGRRTWHGHFARWHRVTRRTERTECDTRQCRQGGSAGHHFQPSDGDLHTCEPRFPMP